MSALDDLIKRAIATDALPLPEIQDFAEGIGKSDMFEQLVRDAEANQDSMETPILNSYPVEPDLPFVPDDNLQDEQG